MALEVLTKCNLTVMEVMEVVLEETVVGVDHRTVCKGVDTAVGIVVVLIVDITLPGLKEICLDEDVVEVDLIKVQMLVDL